MEDWESIFLSISSPVQSPELYEVKLKNRSNLLQSAYVCKAEGLFAEQEGSDIRDASFMAHREHCDMIARF